MRTNRRQTLRCLLAIAAFAAFLFSTTRGELHLLGDDIWFLSGWVSTGETYVRRVSQRSYLNPFYIAAYGLAGHDTTRMHLLFFALHVAVGFLCFAALRTPLGNRVAAFAALFLLSYTGTSEVILWLSAGGYLVVVAAALLSVWIAASGWWGPWRRALAVAAINWPVAHLYELGITAAPLYPAVWVVWRRARRLPITLAGLAPALLPLAMFLFHWFLMYLGTPPGSKPAWMRNGMDTGARAIGAQIARTLELGFESSVGETGQKLAKASLRAFAGVTPKTALLSLTAAAALAGLWWLAFGFRPKHGGAHPPDEEVLRHRLALGCGAFLWLLTPAVGFTTLPLDLTFLPPRLLSFSAVGLAILFGLFLHWAPRWGRIGKGLAAVGLAGLALQAAAFHGMLSANENTWRFDNAVRRQINGFGIGKTPEHSIFLSLAHDARVHSVWRAFPPQFLTGIIQPVLLFDAGLAVGQYPRQPHERLLYFRDLREEGSAAVAYPFQLDAAARTLLLPFFQREGDAKVFGIRRLRFADSTGVVARTEDVPAFLNYPDASETIEAEVMPASIVDPYVGPAAGPGGERQIHLGFHDASRLLTVRGALITDTQEVPVELVQAGRVIQAATFRPRPSLNFEWHIPYSAIDPAARLTIRSRTGSGVLWRVTGFALRSAPSQPAKMN